VTKPANRQGYDYDAVIIGSGIGGLVSAAYLARRGVRVLVCEQHRQPGGYFTSFKRKGYTFDGGIQACEDCGILLSCLEQLGVRDRIELHRSTFAYATPDVFLPLNTAADIARFYAELSKVFPDESQGISFISKKVFEFSSAMEAFTSLPNPLFVPFSHFLGALPGWIVQNWKELKSGPELMRHMSITMEDFFRQHLRDPDLLRFLGQLGYEGTPAAFVLGMVTFVLDYYYPIGGIQAISDVLAESIQERGGTIRYKTLVEEILLEGDRAGGVRLKGGETIRAPFVISNSDARRTFLNMLPASSVPEAYRQRLQRAEVCESAFTVFLGVDIPTEDLPIQGCHHIYFFPNYQGVDFKHDIDDPELYSRSAVELCVPSVTDPALAPKGKTSMVLQCIATADYCKEWGTKNGRRTADYRRLKEKVARQVIATAETLIPGLSKRIEYMDVATPFTMERYTLNSRGSSSGWSYHPRKGLNAGASGMTGFLTPVKNLYAVGHWTATPGGAPAGFISGKIVSEIVRRRLGKTGGGN
jgi:phytoene dehydrogenase-like protein